MLVEHTHLRHPWSQDCVEDVKVLIVLEHSLHVESSQSAAFKHSLRIMFIDSLPDACVSLVISDIIFLSMSPRRSTLPICSGASNPAGLIITPFLARVELHTPLLCVPRSRSEQPAQRVQPCTEARIHACDDGEPRVSDSLTIYA